MPNGETIHQRKSRSCIDEYYDRDDNMMEGT